MTKRNRSPTNNKSKLFKPTDRINNSRIIELGSYTANPSIIFKSSYVNDTKLLAMANRRLYYVFNEFLERPMVLEKIGYTEIKSLIDGKYNLYLDFFTQTIEETLNHAIDRKRALHITQLFDVMAIRCHTIPKLMNAVHRATANLQRELKNGYTQKDYKYAINIIVYADLFWKDKYGNYKQRRTN